MAGEIRVLAVDEDEDVLELTEAFLERESDVISVTAERRVSDAIDRLEAEEFDCVVSDLRMPEMDGLEFFEEVREREQGLPFFLVSAANDREIQKRAGEAGVTDFVHKDAGTDHYLEIADRIEDAV